MWIVIEDYETVCQFDTYEEAKEHYDQRTKGVEDIYLAEVKEWVAAK